MKRRTSWIIGITAAAVTLISLNAAFGSRYKMHHGFYNHHSCIYDKENGENKINPSAESKSDSTNRR